MQIYQRHSCSRGTEGTGNKRLHALAVGFLAFDQVGSLQRDTGEQTSGSTVGENRRGAAKSHISLHIP